MSKSSKRQKDQTSSAEVTAPARYEYRVWGKHKGASEKLAGMAQVEIREEIEDCYLFLDNPDWNAKVRNSKLKLKHLVSEKKGFERWTSNWHTDAESTPEPFDDVFNDLALDRPQRGKRYDIARAVADLDEDSDTRVLFVKKQRRRYQIGAITAEVAKLDVEGTSARLHTIAIQGDSLKELRALLSKIGLDGLPNIPMHVVLEETLDSAVSS